MSILRTSAEQSAGAWDACATPGDFRKLIENTSDIITVVDDSGIIKYASPSTHRVLGYAAGEIVGRSIFEFLDPSELDSLQIRFGEALFNLRPGAPAEYRFRHRDGSWRTLEGVGSRLVSEGGEIDLIVNARDVTDRRLAERQDRSGSP